MENYTIISSQNNAIDPASFRAPDPTARLQFTTLNDSLNNKKLQLKVVSVPFQTLVAGKSASIGTIAQSFNTLAKAGKDTGQLIVELNRSSNQAQIVDVLEQLSGQSHVAGNRQGADLKQLGPRA